MTTCTKCGQDINEVVMIDNKPYGTTCGARMLGYDSMPSWFKGGDWNEAKEQHDKQIAYHMDEYQKARAITSANWDTYKSLCKAYRKSSSNDWARGFIDSIAYQLGYIVVGFNLDKLNCGTFADAEQNWPNYAGSFPYLYREPKSIDSLSSKQQQILSRYL